MYMISRTCNQQLENQRGVSLMLAVLVLAAITAIAFSLSTIVLIELRASGDVVRSEPALYATLGVTEEAMFQYKRFVGDPYAETTSQFDVPSCSSDQEGDSDICTLGGVQLTLPGTQPLVEDDVPRLETVHAGQTVTIPMYQLNSWDVQYSNVEVELVPIGSDGTLTATLRSIDVDGNVDQAQFGQIKEGGGSATTSDFLGDRQYELVLHNSSIENNMLVSIITYGPGFLNPRKGLPFIAKRVLKVVADYAGMTRTYRVQIPVP